MLTLRDVHAKTGVVPRASELGVEGRRARTRLQAQLSAAPMIVSGCFDQRVLAMIVPVIQINLRRLTVCIQHVQHSVRLVDVVVATLYNSDAVQFLCGSRTLYRG